MSSRIDFTSGSVPRALIHFALPVMFALFLQAMYGTVDLLIVGQFASSTDVSAVATGSQIMQTVTNLISSLATGTTVLLGQKIGQKKPSEGGKIAGASLILFAFIGIAFSLLLTLGAAPLSHAMNAPEAAFLKTVHYLSICGGGALIMIFYNLIGGLFRGIGDSRTPFIAVAIACVSNIVLDLLMVAVFSFGAAGAALATVLSQAISVLVSYHLISNRPLPFAMTRAHVTFHKETIKRILSLGIPLAVQDLFVGLSFLIILAIANRLGVNASAGVGVSEKICASSCWSLLPLCNPWRPLRHKTRGLAACDERRRRWIDIGPSSSGFGAFMARLESAPEVNKRLKSNADEGKKDQRLLQFCRLLRLLTNLLSQKDCRSRGKGTDEVRHSLHNLVPCSHSGNVRAGNPD